MAVPLKVSESVFSLELPMLHEATVSVPMSSRLSACPTLAPQNTQDSDCSTVMVGTDAPGVSGTSGFCSSTVPSEPQAVRIVVARNAATKNMLVINLFQILFISVP